MKRSTTPKHLRAYLASSGAEERGEADSSSEAVEVWLVVLQGQVPAADGDSLLGREALDLEHLELHFAHLVRELCTREEQYNVTGCSYTL